MTPNDTGTVRQGRTVPPLPQFTFDTGITVGIRKVSPLLLDEVQKAFPPPKPPTQEMVVDGEKIIEENPAHPDYQEALKKHRRESEYRTRRLLIKRGVEVDIDVEALQELREQMREFGVELDPDDKVAYVSYVCVGTSDDIGDLVNRIIRRSVPTEEAVAEATERFSA